MIYPSTEICLFFNILQHLTTESRIYLFGFCSYKQAYICLEFCLKMKLLIILLAAMVILVDAKHHKGTFYSLL